MLPFQVVVEDVQQAKTGEKRVIFYIEPLEESLQFKFKVFCFCFCKVLVRFCLTQV